MRQRPDSHLCLGETAPDFQLPDASDEPFILSHELEKGPIILVFYPADFGVVCSIEMREFKEMREEFERRGYRVVWINTDSTESHRRWRVKMGIPFQMVSDPLGEVSRLYGIFLEEDGMLKNFSNRSVFVIGGDGCIIYKWVADRPAISPDLKDIISAIDGNM